MNGDMLLIDPLRLAATKVVVFVLVLTWGGFWKFLFLGDGSFVNYK